MAETVIASIQTSGKTDSKAVDAPTPTSTPRTMSTLLSNVRNFFRRQPRAEVVPEAIIETTKTANPFSALGRLCKDDASRLKFDSVKQLERLCRDVDNPEIVAKFILRGTTLMSLPVGIARFSNLTEIVVPHNDIVELPWSLICLRKLKVLDLSHNHLKVVPSLMGHILTLQHVDLSHNDITILPTSFVNLINLTVLKLERNKMVSPPQQVCDEGLESVFVALRSRHSRTNLWKKNTMYYHASGDGVHCTSGLKSLLEMCVQCILDCQFDLFTAPVPPMLKNHLMEEKSNLESKIQVAKCDRCLGYFSSVERFNNHHCKVLRAQNIHQTQAASSAQQPS